MGTESANDGEVMRYKIGHIINGRKILKYQGSSKYTLECIRCGHISKKAMPVSGCAKCSYPRIKYSFKVGQIIHSTPARKIIEIDKSKKDSRKYLTECMGCFTLRYYDGFQLKEKRNCKCTSDKIRKDCLNIGDIKNNRKIKSIDLRNSTKGGKIYNVECLNCGKIKTINRTSFNGYGCRCNTKGKWGYFVTKGISSEIQNTVRGVFHRCLYDKSRIQKYNHLTQVIDKDWIPKDLNSKDSKRRAMLKMCLYIKNNIGEPNKENNETLDRIDPNKGYIKGNLRWADKKIQSQNRRVKLHAHEVDDIINKSCNETDFFEAKGWIKKELFIAILRENFKQKYNGKANRR